MLTQTHVFVGVALFGMRNAKTITMAAICGALVPDSDVWIMIITEFFRGTPGCEVFHFRYLQQPWSDVQAVVNSVPIYLVLLMIGAAGYKLGSGWGQFLAIFSLSALLHVSTDFLLHHDDARRHFWPLSNWIFRSPVSYWDPAYYGRIFAVFEIVGGLVLARLLWLRSPGKFGKTLIALACLGYSVTIVASLMGQADHDRGVGSCGVKMMPVE